MPAVDGDIEYESEDEQYRKPSEPQSQSLPSKLSSFVTINNDLPPPPSSSRPARTIQRRPPEASRPYTIPQQPSAVERSIDQASLPPHIRFRQKTVLPPPVSLQYLPDDFMESLQRTMRKQTDMNESRVRTGCPVCPLIPPVRGPSGNIVFSKRHVEECHVTPLALSIARYDPLDPLADSLWLAMMALKVKRRASDNNRATDEMRADADTLIGWLLRPVAERPVNILLPELRRWSITFANNAVTKLTCSDCGLILTRPESLQRHRDGKQCGAGSVQGLPGTSTIRPKGRPANSMKAVGTPSQQS